MGTPAGDVAGAFLAGAALAGAAFVFGTALDDDSFAGADLMGTPIVGAALAVAAFAAIALTAGCLVVAPLPVPVDDIPGGVVDAAALLLTVEEPSGPDDVAADFAGRGTFETEEAGAVLPAPLIPLAAVPADGGPRVSTVDAWFAGGIARAPPADTAGRPLPGEEDIEEDASAAAAFRGASLSDVDDTIGEEGASDAAFATGWLDTDVADDATGRGTCCAFFPCPVDGAAAATEVLCRDAVEMP